MKRTVSLVTAFFAMIVLQAQTPTNLPTDTLVRDLSDLEEKMQAESITAKADTTYYGTPKQRNFNALDYSLDSRYQGDKWTKGGFSKHTFLDFGAGAVLYQHNNNHQLTMQAGIHLRMGKELSPMSSIRLGIGGELGYISGEPNANWTMRTNADYLFNFSNYLLGYRPDRPLSVSGILGLGVQHSHLTKYNGSAVAGTMKDKATSYNIHTGLQFKFHAGTHAALAIEPYIMAGTEGMDLDKSSKFNHFSFGYGVNLSYIWYFYNNMSSQKDAGDFKKYFADGKRLFLEDPARLRWRRPWFFEYSIGPAYYHSTDLKVGKTLGYSVSANIGQWMSSAIGLRAGINLTNAAWTKTSETTSLLGKSGVSLDAMLNPFGFTRHYNWDSAVGVNLYGGYEMGLLQFVHANIRTICRIQVRCTVLG